jgi:two-component system, cell cycle sensor histidine kinase and response regulator CckA
MTVSPDQPSPLPDITPGPWLRLTVADTGTGIQPDHLDHIFDPFFTTKAPGKGTGLGLAQVYGIIKQHNGSINVDSRIESGTVFTIYLPLIDNTQEAESLVVEQGIVPGGSETILLVEDSPVMRHSIQETLTNLGYRVIEAENGAVALAYLANGQEPIELVISDLMMPEIGGIELHQRLRQLQPDLKLLLISGYPPEKDHEALQGLGWLPKPFGLRQLATCVRQLLDE